MSPAMRPIETMQRWFSPEREPSLLADDVVWILSPGYPAPRHHYVGREAVLGEFLPQLRARFASWGAVVSGMFEADAGRVITQGHYRGALPDGRPVTIPFLHVWTIADGRITRLDAVADWACLPPPG